MRRVLPLAIAVAVLGGGVSGASAREVYCYMSVMPSGDKLTRAVTPAKLYVTPVFDSSEDVYLLAALFQETLPEAGLATCVTDEDEPDIEASWKSFVDSAKADGNQVEIISQPED